MELLSICLPANAKHKYGLLESINLESHGDDFPEMKVKKKITTTKTMYVSLIFLTAANTHLAVAMVFVANPSVA